MSAERRHESESATPQTFLTWTRAGFVLIAAGALLLWWDTPAPPVLEKPAMERFWGIPQAFYHWEGFHKTPAH